MKHSFFIIKAADSTTPAKPSATVVEKPVVVHDPAKPQPKPASGRYTINR